MTPYFTQQTSSSLFVLSKQSRRVNPLQNLIEQLRQSVPVSRLAHRHRRRRARGGAAIARCSMRANGHDPADASSPDLFSARMTSQTLALWIPRSAKTTSAGSGN